MNDIANKFWDAFIDLLNPGVINDIGMTCLDASSGLYVINVSSESFPCDKQPIEDIKHDIIRAGGEIDLLWCKDWLPNGTRNGKSYYEWNIGFRL